VFTLIPSESRRLIGKGVAAMKAVKDAREKGYPCTFAGKDLSGLPQRLRESI
jgi:hypothetical protein